MASAALPWMPAIFHAIRPVLWSKLVELSKLKYTAYATTHLLGSQLSLYAQMLMKSRKTRLLDPDNLRSRDTTRNYQRDDQPTKTPLRLMDFPELWRPQIIKTMRNFFFTGLIRAHYDANFTLESFLVGSRQAAEAVSAYISQGDFNSLRGLVDDEAIQEIQKNYARLTADQKNSVAMESRDVLFQFVHEVGMMFDDETEQRFVEITVVFHGIHGFATEVGDIRKSFGEFQSYFAEKNFSCNYRFIREFTKGKETDWTINKLNHFNVYLTD